eukprot:TRINITY_DN112051_c0_g1_i1.p1 TRINITY_DN112051_c0_g1~~TRINITY_DN112051_c0_g1_i1.p1  ORF type:complete len:326 (+),score=69.97 TRINITY_DN112051_c0_g1_i1:92-1069(+)
MQSRYAGPYPYGTPYQPGPAGSFVDAGFAKPPAMMPPPPAQFETRRRLNFAAVGINLLVPWLLYLVVSALVGFSMPVNQPVLFHALLLACSVFVVCTGYFCYHSWRLKAHGGGGGGPPTWAAFLFLSSVMAFWLAYGVGSWSFSSNMAPYLEIMNLNAYPSVDPKNYTGQQMMDMGQVTFSQGSHIDVSKAMGFRSFDTYCVAPVVTGSGEMSVYDFWAVGINCCESRGDGYNCGEFSNAKARSGLRLMRDDLRSFFRLAVKQAEAEHKIQTQQPVFLYWMEDTAAELQAYTQAALSSWIAGAIIYFCAQTVLVAAATVAFAKMV